MPTERDGGNAHTGRLLCYTGGMRRLLLAVPLALLFLLPDARAQAVRPAPTVRPATPPVYTPGYSPITPAMMLAHRRTADLGRERAKSECDGVQLPLQEKIAIAHVFMRWGEQTPEPEPTH